MLDTSVEDRGRQWKSFGVGSAVEALAIVLVLWMGTLLPSVPPENESKNLWSTNVTLLTPVLPRLVQRPIAAPVVKAPLPITSPKMAVQTPKVVEPKPVTTPALVARARTPMEPPTLHPASQPAEVARPALPRWEPKVQVGAFNGSAAAEAKMRLPESKVQTGGFGSPSGLPGMVQSANRGNVAHLGAFDLPAGPGAGNGSGGAQGAVASAGFGDTTAAAPARGVPGGARVASAGFGDATTGALAQESRPGGQVASAGFTDAQSLTHASGQAKAQQATVAFDPVEIISKPNPVYTEEARRLHIQGEVLLRVVFGASGRLQILGVARGLGHGLDQAAIQAAQQIQFRPARRNGQPVNTAATLHILFELAA